MTSPSVVVGMWDSERSSRELLADLCQALRALGAQFTSEGDSFATFSGVVPLDIDGVDVTIETHRPNNDAGGLLDMSIAASELDVEPPEKWWPLRDALVEIILAVDPVIANIAIDVLPYELPDVSWEEAQTLFASGWVNLDHCTPVQRQSFLEHHERGFGTKVGHGLWWGTEDFALQQEALPPGENQALAYSAWMQTTPPADRQPAAETPAEIQIAPPQLWFWRPDLNVDKVGRLVAKTVEPLGLDHAILWDQYGPAWATAVVWLNDFGPEELRIWQKLIELIQPAWAGVLPLGTDIAVGYPTGEFTVTTPITELWVDHDWIRDSLGELDGLLSRGQRQEILGGVRWVTHTSLGSNGQARWNGTVLELDEAMHVSSILTRAVQRLVFERYGELPGGSHP